MAWQFAASGFCAFPLVIMFVYIVVPDGEWAPVRFPRNGAAVHPVPGAPFPSPLSRQLVAIRRGRRDACGVWHLEHENWWYPAWLYAGTVALVSLV